MLCTDSIGLDVDDPDRRSVGSSPAGAKLAAHVPMSRLVTVDTSATVSILPVFMAFLATREIECHAAVDAVVACRYGSACFCRDECRTTNAPGPPPKALVCSMRLYFFNSFWILTANAVELPLQTNSNTSRRQRYGPSSGCMTYRTQCVPIKVSPTAPEIMESQRPKRRNKFLRPAIQSTLFSKPNSPPKRKAHTQ